MLKTLLQLRETGELKKMVSVGLVSAKVYLYLEIYLWIDARMKATGKNITTIAAEAEFEFKLSRGTIWTAIGSIKAKLVSTETDELN